MEVLFSFALVDLSVPIDPILMQHQRAITRRLRDALSLRRWSSVCCDWRDAIEGLIAQHQVRTIHLDFHLRNAEELTEKLATSLPEPRRVKDLRVCIYRPMSSPTSPSPSVIDWRQMLSRCGNLLRLDLSNMGSLTVAEIADVFDAASSCCLQLQSLILPSPYNWKRHPCQSRFTYDRRPDLTDTQPIMAALEVALRRWRITGSPLQQLVLPLNGTADGDAFVSLITKYAPKIQLVDAWKQSYFSDGWGDASCREHWHLNSSTWKVFCYSCVELREFNLGLVPITDAFLAPFSVKTKWKLTQLTLVVPSCTSTLFRGATEARRTVAGRTRRVELPPKPINMSSATLCNLVRALPRLEELRIDVPSNVTLDLHAFDDDLLVALERSCPGLKKLQIGCGRGATPANVLTKITDRGLEALGSLAKLEQLVLRPLWKLPGAALMPLLLGHSQTQTQNQSIPQQLDAKVLLPDHTTNEALLEIMEAVRYAMEIHPSHTRPFAIQVALLESPLDVMSMDWITEGKQRKKAYPIDPRFREFQAKVADTRLRSQAVKSPHATRITQVTLFSTAWKRRDSVTSLFLPNEIISKPESNAPFHWSIE